jgi:hypothetical protein
MEFKLPRRGFWEAAGGLASSVLGIGKNKQCRRLSFELLSFPVVFKGIAMSSGQDRRWWNPEWRLV